MLPFHLRAPRLLARTACLLPLSGCTSPGVSGDDLPDPRAPAVAIVGETVIGGTGEAATDSGIVVIEGERFRAVGSAEDVRLPSGAEIIDGAGHFLVPGFIDAQAHVALGPVTMGRIDAGPTMSMEVDSQVSRRSLRTLLGHGVTTIRDPGGPMNVLVERRDRVERGEVTEPHMRVAGEVIDQSSFPGLVEQVHTPDEVRAAVRRQVGVGVDMIKLYTSLTPELLQAGIGEAHAHELPAVGHVMATSWTQAAEMDIDGIVHVIPGSPGLLPADSAGALIESMRRGTQFVVRWFELVDDDAPVMEEAIRALARNDVILDPTLVFFDALVRGDEPAVTEAPELALAAPVLVDNWRSSFELNPGWTEEDFRRGRLAFPKMLELTRLLHEGDVTPAAGTDANNPWGVPGPSFHRELQLLVEADIPPEEVLVIATANGARAARLLDDRGTIEPGKRADMVLLSRDPRQDNGATRELRWVMQGGRLLDPDSLLRSVTEPRATESRDLDPGGAHD